jgi:hypothetical protein
VHGIVPGGGLAPDGARWVACKQGFFLSVRVLSRLFRRRFLEELHQAHRSGRLQFFGEYAALDDARTFAQWLAPLRECEWVVYAKRPPAASSKESNLAGLCRNISSRPPSGQSTSRKLTLTPPLNRGEEAGYMIIIQTPT